MSKRAFITGGASGLGRAFAEAYAKDGWRVCIGDIHEKRLEEAVAALGPNAHGLRCDVTKEEDLLAAARWMKGSWGGCDLLVNNAGVAQSGPIDATPMEDWAWIVDINLLGVVRGCKAFVPMMKEQRSGWILSTASMAGLIHPPGAAAYNATKAAVVSISETLRTELAPHGVGVSVLCPAFVRTNLLENFRGSTPDAQRTTTRLVTRAKLGPEDVARIVKRDIAKGKFLIMPNPEGRTAYRAKRWIPSPIFKRIVVKRAERAMEDRSKRAEGK